ncbi:MAG: acetate/propionate family kinase [Halomonas sp.]|uniref:acetate/propionate family kinase n=1 Tax=Halomonas sp. TaxID=1486246 RepID=UPI003F8F1277
MGDILVLNSGSSSLKFALYSLNIDNHDTTPGAIPSDLDSALVRRFRGSLSGLGHAPGLHPEINIRDTDNQPIASAPLPDGPLSVGQALALLLEWITQQPDLDDISVVGHRIVHGGRRHHDPVLLNDAIIAELDALTPLAPLHQPGGLEPIRQLAALHPNIKQVACFDTAFHAGMPDVARQFAIPRELTDQGLIRYGFHGLSFDYINRSLAKTLGDRPSGRVIIAHLGNGASLCAVADGQSQAATTGLTALEGLPMGTRSGSIDPGLILHLLDQYQMPLGEVTDLLYKRSGLLGMSGISSDMYELETSDDPRAAQAIALYAYRIVREIGSLTAALGGLDHLVFTAGIGENSARLRQRVCQGCEWLGITLSSQANDQHGPRISGDDSRVGVWVIPTDEERMIAWYSAQL